jgi:hypothetical protein
MDQITGALLLALLLEDLLILLSQAPLGAHALSERFGECFDRNHQIPFDRPIFEQIRVTSRSGLR